MSDNREEVQMTDARSTMKTAEMIDDVLRLQFERGKHAARTSGPTNHDLADHFTRSTISLKERVASLEKALRAIVDTDTHGKNVRDESGTMRPTGADFCGRCNRNSFHPHADDCPIALAIKMVDG
jgi:hypothetical protein